MQRNDVSRFKIVSMASLHSQILHFLIFVYIKAKLYNQSLKQFWQMLYLCFPFLWPYYHVNQNRSPFNEKFVLALDYMLYAFYDLKSISWPWRSATASGIGRNTTYSYTCFWAAIRSTLLKPAQRKAIILHHFLPVFNDFSIYH
jgi:hypothetical protein